jgi:hypothetical protein
VKTYTVDAESYQRPITLPVLATVKVSDNGALVDPANTASAGPAAS